MASHNAGVDATQVGASDDCDRFRFGRRLPLPQVVRFALRGAGSGPERAESSDNAALCPGQTMGLPR